jgi:hypothetical protein
MSARCRRNEQRYNDFQKSGMSKDIMISGNGGMSKDIMISGHGVI